MVVTITLGMTMRWVLSHVKQYEIIYRFLTCFNCLLKNVDAGAAKELMVYLVKLQSSLLEVNEYVHYATCFLDGFNK